MDERELYLVAKLVRSIMLEWKKEFPSKPGSYWFYGERYKNSARGNKPPRIEMLFCKVRGIANGGVAVVAEGAFVFKAELGYDWKFAEMTLPEPPEISVPVEV